MVLHLSFYKFCCHIGPHRGPYLHFYRDFAAELAPCMVLPSTFAVEILHSGMLPQNVSKRTAPDDTPGGTLSYYLAAHYLFPVEFDHVGFCVCGLCTVILSRSAALCALCSHVI